MILAAGYGTRLRPLTDELPKPMMPVGDRPAIVHVAHALSAVATRLVVNTHHRPEAFDGLKLPLPHIALRETEILGTAGGVANARAHFDDGDVVVWNGDIVADVNTAALVARLTTTGALAAWVVAPRAKGEGTVGLSADGFIVRVRSTTVGDEAQGGDFLGVSALCRRALDLLPSVGCLVADVAQPALARGERIAASLHHGPWDDIGNKRSFYDANVRWLAARAQFVAAGADVGPGCDVAGSIIGSGAVVRAHATRSVVFPGAHVDRAIDRAIVSARGTFVTVD